MELAVDQRGRRQQIGKALLQLRPQIAHQKDDLRLLEAGIEEIEGDGETEGVDGAVGRLAG